MKKLQNLISISFCFLLFFSPTMISAKEKWTVKGTLKVNHYIGFMKDVYGTSSPLAGVKVKVYARAKNFAGWGTWNSWTVVTTKSDGTFSVSKETGTDRRQFKIKILFDSDELMIKEGQETSLSFGGDGFPIDISLDLTDKDWHEIYNEKEDGPSDGHRAGVIQVGDLNLNSGMVRKHGDIWYLYSEIIDLFDSYGGDYDFNKKVRIKYPMGIGNNGDNTASYCNPLNNMIYIKESDFDGNTLIHELMHRWAFDHSTGEDGMAWQLIKHQTTHDAREATTFVPFNEAWADFAAYKVLREITAYEKKKFNSDSESLKPHRPYTRSYIGAIEPILANVDYTERGWYSLFNVLTFNHLGKLDFNVSGTYAESGSACEDANIDHSLKQLMSLFLKHSSKGVDKYLDKDEQDFRDFLNRAKKILPGMTDERVKHIKSYLNPAATKNPRDYYCPGIGSGTIIDKQVNPNVLNSSAIQTKTKTKKKN